MSDRKQLFSPSLAKDAVYRTGLRSFMEYRDLGIKPATHGQFRAHVIRIKKEAAGAHALHTTACTSTCATSRCSTCSPAGSSSSTTARANTRSTPVTASCSRPGSCTDGCPTSRSNGPGARDARTRPLSVTVRPHRYEGTSRMDEIRLAVWRGQTVTLRSLAATDAVAIAMAGRSPAHR